MRVAMIGCRGIPARTGGVERVVEDLTRELTQRGHEVLVYGRSHYLRDAGSPDAGRCLRTPGVSWRSLDALSHTATAMADVLRRGVDVVHVHSPGPGLLAICPRLAGLAVVLTVHAPDWRRARWSAVGRTVLRAGLSVGVRSAGRVTAVSRELAGELSERFGRPVQWVPNGVATPGEVDATALGRWGLSSGRYVLHVGRIVPEKRLDVLIRAFRASGLCAPLVVAGDEPEPGFARSCRALAEGLDVRFLGGVYGPELEALYGGAALLAQPSGLEGASLVVLEGARRGRAVLAGDIAANRELLGGEACYVPVGDSVAFGEALLRCYNDDGWRASVGDRARRRVMELFSLPAVAEAYEAVYRAAGAEC